MNTMKKKQNEQVEFELPETIAELDELCSELWDKAAEAEDKKERAALILKYNMAAGACNRLAGAERMKVITAATKLVPSPKEPEKPAAKQTKAQKQKGLKVKEQLGDVPPPPKQNVAEVALTAYAPDDAIVVDEETKREPIALGSEITFAFAGSKVTGKVYELTELDTFKVNGNDGLKYHVKPEDVMRHGETPVQFYGRKAKQEKQKEQQAPKAKEAKEPKAKKEAKPAKVTRDKPVLMVKTKAMEKILAQDVPGAVHIREVWDLVGPTKFDILDFELISGIGKDRIIGCLKKYVKNFDYKKYIKE